MDLTKTQLLFVFAFAIILLLAFLLLRPFKLHRKRPISTFSLKFSYLLYLIAAFITVFLFIFNFGHAGNFFDDIDNPRAATHFTILLFTLVIPSAGIFLRRRFEKRDVYNKVFIAVNVICMAYYLLLVEVVFKVTI